MCEKEIGEGGGDKGGERPKEVADYRNWLLERRIQLNAQEKTAQRTSGGEKREAGGRKKAERPNTEKLTKRLMERPRGLEKGGLLQGVRF